MKIAMLGSRGVPASYSGFETYYEQLGARLVAARPPGHRLLPVAPHHLRRADLSRHAAGEAAHHRQQIPGHHRPQRASPASMR